jgi:hypothetical protein
MIAYNQSFYEFMVTFNIVRCPVRLWLMNIALALTGILGLPN